MHPQEITGNHVVGTWNKGGGSPIAMFMHMDTVHPAGTLAQRPVRIEGGRFYGPGSYDMKASHVIALFAIRALRELDVFPKREVRLVFTSDEETGSDTSRALIEDLARGAALALVMEPALADGRLKERAQRHRHLQDHCAGQGGACGRQSRRGHQRHPGVSAAGDQNSGADRLPARHHVFCGRDQRRRGDQCDSRLRRAVCGHASDQPRGCAMGDEHFARFATRAERRDAGSAGRTRPATHAV